MEFVQQHATVISATVGTGSFIVALISNREKVREFIIKHWLVIGGFFALMGLWSLYEHGALAFLMRLWDGLVNLIGVRLPIWAIFAAIVVVFGFRWIFRLIVNRLKRHDKQGETTVSPQHFQDEDYREDMIDGVWWQWTYSGNLVNTPRPICPDRACQCDLVFREDYNRIRDGPNAFHIGAPPVTLHCQRCRFRREFDKTEDEVLHGVGLEIIRLLRTGQFRDRLARRAANQ
jgi:hypothetical protein